MRCERLTTCCIYNMIQPAMKKQQQIEAKIEKTKAAINGLGRMRPGSLSHQPRARGQQYCQLSYSHDGKGHTEYVRPDHVAQVERELGNYRRFRELMRKWIGQEIELSKLNRKQD
jgi:hypothetical protein